MTMVLEICYGMVLVWPYGMRSDGAATVHAYTSKIAKGLLKLTLLFVVAAADFRLAALRFTAWKKSNQINAGLAGIRWDT